ncbi:MAG TPA: tail fiber domain-containing protein, partial [Vicinamibacterales bacterium]|nr:tail fiber domain-containing protein [Vicinamibacterales bacterium]
VGQGALTANSGPLNTAVGESALGANTAGAANTAVGQRALVGNTIGDGNTSMGSDALQANVVGNSNTAVGAAALLQTTGFGNTAAGADAGFGIVAGSLNTFLGTDTAAGSSNLSNATALGAHARVDRSNSIVLGSINFVNGATSDVNVGIGTTSPDGRLEIATQDFASDILITTADGAPDLVTQASEGLLVSPLASASGSLLFNLRAQGYTGTAFQESANITVRTTEAWTGSASGARIEFSTTPNGTTNRANRMVIDHDGEVGINTLTPLDRLHVVGDIRVGTTGTNGCLKGNGGAAIAGTCSSDARFKRDITPFGPALERVTALRPVHYFWRAAAFPEKGFGTEQTYGLIAQEVEQVLPEIVTTDADGFKAVDYAKLPLLLLQALRELKDENDALKARMATFEALLASSTPSPRKH